MAKKSSRFIQAEHSQARATFPPEVQAALATSNTQALIDYMTAELAATNMPPTQRTALVKLFKLVLLKGE